MVPDGDLFLQKLLHWVAETYTAAKVLVIKVLHLIKNRSSSTLGKLAQKLGCNLVSCGAHKDSFEIVSKTEVSDQPLFQKHAYICGK